MICDRCGNDAKDMRGAIIQGLYGQYCIVCTGEQERSASAQSASYDRDRDRETHAKDLLQPWVNGEPSREFIRNYPESAQDMYTKEELENYG